MTEKKEKDLMRSEKEQEKKELGKKLNAIVRFRTDQSQFGNDAPPDNFFPTYDDIIKKGKDKAVFIFYKEKGSLEIELIIAHPLSIIKEIIRLENEKIDSFEKYQKSCILPLISEHRLGASLKKKNQNRPFYIDLDEIRKLKPEYCFKNKDDLLKNYKRIF